MEGQGRVLTKSEIDDVRRALEGKPGGRSMNRPDSVMWDLMSTLDAYRNCPQCAHVVATRETVEVGDTLRAEIRDDGRVTLSVYPHATRSTVSAVYLRELAKQADEAADAALRSENTYG